jgi:two-component system LytT family response regulator
MEPNLTSQLRIVIVDDEEDACNNLQYMLNTCAADRLHIAGIAHDTQQAQQLIEQHTPDAVFLDIEMPRENAFRFLQRIAPLQFDVVFVTAYDDFAIQAFQLNAVNYLLKPVSPAEIRNTLERLMERKQLRRLHYDPNYRELGDHIGDRRLPDKIVLKENTDVEIVAFTDILFLEAMGSYSKIYFLRAGLVKTKTLSNNIAGYEAIFPQHLFYRIHKSYLVNCSHLSRILKEEQVYVVIKKEFTLPVSRRRYTDMLSFLKEHNFYAA